AAGRARGRARSAAAPGRARRSAPDHFDRPAHARPRHSSAAGGDAAGRARRRRARAGLRPRRAARGARPAARPRRRLARALRDAPPREAPAHARGDLLAHAFPDRIGRVHPRDPQRYLLANGRTARLADDSALRGEPWIVASELRHEARDALVLRAAPVDEARLRRDFGERFIERDEVRWDEARRALVAERVRRFDGIVLDARPAGSVDPALAAQALTDAV